jgi:hypothetical protein
MTYRRIPIHRELATACRTPRLRCDCSFESKLAAKAVVRAKPNRGPELRAGHIYGLSRKPDLASHVRTVDVVRKLARQHQKNSLLTPCHGSENTCGSGVFWKSGK